MLGLTWWNVDLFSKGLDVTSSQSSYIKNSFYGLLEDIKRWREKVKTFRETTKS
jgi:hypothetical protein